MLRFFLPTHFLLSWGLVFLQLGYWMPFIVVPVIITIIIVFLYRLSCIYHLFLKKKKFMSLEQAGLSMALGAFLAGLLLAETEFSLQVESDIAPYRGLLLGLFFMTVGSSPYHIHERHFSIIPNI